MHQASKRNDKRLVGALVMGFAVGLVGALLGAPRFGVAQAPPTSAGPANPQLIEDLVVANRILAIEGVLDAIGHVSVRHDRNPNRYLLSRARAPELVTAEDIMEFDLDGTPVDPRGRALYSERFYFTTSWNEGLWNWATWRGAHCSSDRTWQMVHQTVYV